MREIKFRGKRIWTDEWIYGNLVIDKHGRNHIVPFAYFDEDGHHLSYDDDTDTPVFIMQESVGQFTGLQDKNGKEIYEGDRLRWVAYGWPMDEYKELSETRELVVKWVCGGFDVPYEDETESCYEVIGNIHEATK